MIPMFGECVQQVLITEVYDIVRGLTVFIYRRVKCCISL